MWDEIIIFNDRHFPGWRDEDWRVISNALAGEIGEICDATKHFFNGGTNPILVGKVTKDHIAEEVFDAMVYMVLLLGSMGFDKESFLKISRRKLKILYGRMNDG